MNQTPIVSLLLQTALITVVGFYVVSLLARAAGMSDAELVIGPLALAATWFGMRVQIPRG